MPFKEKPMSKNKSVKWALCVTVGKINDVISSPLEQTITNGRLTRESITELITFGQHPELRYLNGLTLFLKSHSNYLG